MEIRVRLARSMDIIGLDFESFPLSENHVPKKPPKQGFNGERRGNVNLSAAEADEQGRRVHTGESRTEPTVLRFVLRRKSSPIWRMISVKRREGQL